MVTGAYRLFKATYQLSFPRDTPGRVHVFIVGCQRSGTSTVLRVFERDFRAKVFSEHSILSSQDLERRIRLNPIPDVQHALRNVRAPIVVLKPLVETQNTPELLDSFANSHAIWCYRHYLPVAVSNLRQFGYQGSIGNLKPIVDRERGNWRAEYVPRDVEETISRLFSESMCPEDGAALFWWVRNRLFYDLGLDKDPRVMMLRYEDFSRDPRTAMEDVYRHLGTPYPSGRATGAVSATASRPDADVAISDEVRELCEELWQRLNQSAGSQKTAR